MNYKNIIFNVIFALTCLASVCFFWRKAILLTIILAIISVISLYKWKNKETIILFIFCGIFGALAEATGIYFGIWIYTLPNIIGIPYWLFILWGDAAVFSYQMAIEIKNLKL